MNMEWIRALLDVLLPPRHEELVVRALNVDDVADFFDVQHSLHGWSVAPYDDVRVRALVWEAKYHHNEHALTLIGHALFRALDEHMQHPVCIIPIPLSERRTRERGYNQVAEALRLGAPNTHRLILPHALTRIRETVPQTQLARKQRLTNVVGCFAVSDDALPHLRGAHVVVVDDVVTTGATLSEARLSLLRAGAAKVEVLAFARS
jgi:ComF family protein